MKKGLSPSVIKEAIDNLPTGLAFADANGRIILMNRTMAGLGSALIGSRPQMRQELERALDSSGGIVKIEDTPPLYQFPDGSIWWFCTAELKEPAGYTQTTARDMTELYHTAAQLRRDNDKLRQVSRDMKEMYERRGSRIRDQEALELKIWIHDSIGAGLIALTDLMVRWEADDADTELDIIKDAVGYLTSDRPLYVETIEDVQRRAAAMQVDLQLEGELPQDTRLIEVIAAAALECVTNCVKHADGNVVRVRTDCSGGCCSVVITNNGKPPEGRIVEGGGLDGIRRRVEFMGGEMAVSHVPAFSLTLVFCEGVRG